MLEKYSQYPKLAKTLFKKTLLSAEGSFRRLQISRPCRKRNDKSLKTIAQCLKNYKKFFSKSISAKNVPVDTYNAALKTFS